MMGTHPVQSNPAGDHPDWVSGPTLMSLCGSHAVGGLAVNWLSFTDQMLWLPCVSNVIHFRINAAV